MGTRGIFGIKYKGIYYTFYNHYDSYFSSLGIDLLKEIKRTIDNNNLNNWISKLINLKSVTENFESNVEENDDYYDLFYGKLGSYEVALNQGVIEIERISTNINYLKNDIFIEWLYI